MRLRLFFDGIPHEIDSTDPDLLARWIVEIFGRLREVNRGTLIEVQVYPSFLYGDNNQYVADWSADSQVISQTARIRTPRELLAALTKQLDEMDALNEEDVREHY